MLTPEQVTQFHREGFLVLPEITTAEDLGQIRALLDGLFDRFHDLPREVKGDLGGDQTYHDGPQFSPQIIHTSRFEPRLLETLYVRNATAVARQLLGSDVGAPGDHAIYKPPHNTRETPWHQDLAYEAKSLGDWEVTRFGCNFWLPLQDATADSGCMQFIPYSNLGNLLPHYSTTTDAKLGILKTDHVATDRAVACPVKAGGCTIHLPKTLHYTAPNDTPNTRRTYNLMFGAPLPGL
jgi:ectoine hydroxylase-related dioxygenase (phytanoyl-CoA dioxygenase family)